MYTANSVLDLIEKSFYDEHCHSRTFQAYYIPLV